LVRRLAQPPLQQKRHLRLRFHFDLSLDRISDETLLVRRVIHFFEFLRRGLFVAGEFESLP
jgi:hypothetical protein